MPRLQEIVCISSRWAAAGHGDAQGTWTVISMDQSLHFVISGSPLRSGLVRGSSDSHRAHEHRQVPSLHTLLQR